MKLFWFGAVWLATMSAAWAQTSSLGPPEFATKDIIALTLATIGAALGVYNTWVSHTARRVRLRVIPKLAYPHGREGPFENCIEIINLSTFAVTVDEVGYTLKGLTQRAVLYPIIRDGKPLPRKLEPREAVSVYGDPKALVPGEAVIDRALAGLVSGEQFTGTSPALVLLRNGIAAVRADLG